MNTKKLIDLFEASTDKYRDAKKMGLSYETMRSIKEGQTGMKVSTLEKVSKFYGVPVGYFFDEAEADGQLVRDLEVENLKGQIEGLKEAIRILKMTPQVTESE